MHGVGCLTPSAGARLDLGCLVGVWRGIRREHYDSKK
jgi:hypothetical protein